MAAPDDAAGGPDRCAGCGLAVPGGSEGCQAIFDELLAKDFSDAAYFRVHRLMVDVYSLQHPDRYCASAKSLAAHLGGLCCVLEHGASPSIGAEWLRDWLNGGPPIERPETPASRGAVTIAAARAATGALEHGEAVGRWARATWEAYAPLHALARDWVERARRGAGPARSPGRPGAPAA